MRKYSRIQLESGQQVPHSTVRGLKLAIKNKKLSPGRYIMTCPGGNRHLWEIINDSTHTSCGRAKGKKNSNRLGKGTAIQNYAANFIKVI